MALAREDPRLGIVPAYGTVRRFMKTAGLFRTRRRKRKDDESFVARETRS